MDQTELLSFVAAALERRNLKYAVTGSHASIAYGENRFTNDIDVLVDLSPVQLPSLLAEFPTDQFYVSEDGAKYAVLHGGQFNIIHQDTSQKVDVTVRATRNGRTSSPVEFHCLPMEIGTRGSSPPRI